jgi:hypothetical protein
MLQKLQLVVWKAWKAAGCRQNAFVSEKWQTVENRAFFSIFLREKDIAFSGDSG